MPTPRVTMQQLKECFRLKFECALSHERIARTLGLSKGVIGKYVSRAQACVFRSMSGHDSGPCRAGVPAHAGRVSEAG